MQLPCSLSTLLASVGLLGFTGHGVVNAAPAAGAAPTVTLKAGKVVGTSTSVTSGFSTTSTAVNYLGIPFAAPPTGSLRFAPPAAPTAWSKPLQATKLPPACRQQFTGGPAVDNATQEVFNNPGHARPAESEDCLYLNVYAPTDASPTNKKSVLFWVFGGNLQFGTASLNYYNGSSFAAFQDVVVVAPNYRTNIFGFINSPEIPTGQQNPGFLDQRAALQWVQDNIAQFGGDPSQVTIFGESAGGYSVKQLLANPPSPLPYRAAIMQSEATTTGEGASYEEVVLHFNCTTAPSQLACLRKVDGKAIEDYIISNSLDFYPNADGVTMVSDVRPNILSKKFADVPILAGTNADEGRVFVALLGLDPGNSSTPALVASSLFPGNATLQQEVVQAYTAVLNVPFYAASQILTDYLFTCTTSALTTFLAANGYANTWRYFYNASFPNEQVFANLGAFHSSEIPQVWGTYDLHNAIASATPDQLALSKYMQTAWANFAKSPSSGPQWPRITADVPYNEMGELGGTNPGGETTINTNIVDYQCALFDGLIAVQGL